MYNMYHSYMQAVETAGQ